MANLIGQYYAWLSGPTAFLTPGLGALADSLNIPVISVLLFGLIGAVAPCQLSASVASLAFLSRSAADARGVGAQTLAFVAGKVLVYLTIGGAIVALGLRINQLSPTVIPLVVAVRHALGPLLIVVGLFLMGLLRLNWSVGGRVSAWIESRVGRRRGVLPAFLLGTAFAFSFCPTLFWLFFGLTVPLAIVSPGGLLFPGVFALGTALPVLALSAFVASGIVDTARFLRRFKAADVWLGRLTGLVFILVGINETILYWLL